MGVVDRENSEKTCADPGEDQVSREHEVVASPLPQGVERGGDAVDELPSRTVGKGDRGNSEAFAHSVVAEQFVPGKPSGRTHSTEIPSRVIAWYIFIMCIGLAPPEKRGGLPT